MLNVRLDIVLREFYVHAITVSVPPLASEDQIIDQFGYIIGQEAFINHTFSANPKPYIEWLVNGETIHEASSDRTGRLQAETLRDLVINLLTMTIINAIIRIF